MTNISTAELAAALTIGTLAGLAIGLLHFALLRRTVAAYVSAAPLRIPLLQTAARFAAGGAAFWLLVQWNAAAAISGLIGFTLAYFALRPSTELN